MFFLSLQPSALFAKLALFTLSPPDLALLVNPTEPKFKDNILLLFSIFLEKNEVNCLEKALANKGANCSFDGSAGCVKVMSNVELALRVYRELGKEDVSVTDKLKFLNLIASGFGFKFKIIKKRLLN